ncbi:hypothetical protein L2E82_44774 [Cichorium intybus]|uniref:Uncharacterized protein n=1 Tax=Cichorium intybus TaxID=13427 RepID=A0ACB8ZS16_CICIN|nr:hypothetical protein L2E82_44774 [Cichorium intybus]
MNVGDTYAGPSKRKTKKTSEDDEEDETELSEAAKREKELDDLLRISRQLDAEEAAKREAALLLESRKLHFPEYSSFDAFDERITNTQPSAIINDMLFNFYLANSKPQYLSWSLKKIVRLTPRMPRVISPFKNAIFLARRGSDQEKDEFTLADLPFMNPFGWVSLFNILSRAEEHEILAEHVKKLLMGYILEFAKLDVEVATVLDSTPECLAEKPPSDLNKRRLRKIGKKEWKGCSFCETNICIPLLH